MQTHGQASWIEEDVVANGIRQHYYRTGGDGPPLLLFHGFSENGLCWSRVSRALAQNYDVIMPDARAHGRSTGPETGYSQDLLTSDGIELISRLELHRPYIWGYSNGALTAMHIAAARPDLVRAVIAEDPPLPLDEATPSPWDTRNEPGKEPWPGFTAWYESWLDWHRALRTQTPEERLASSQQFLAPGITNWSREDLLLHLEAQAQLNLDLFQHVPPMPMRIPWQQTLPHITCQLLLITSNSERGQALGPQKIEQLAQIWQNGQHIAFPQNSHFLHHEMSEEQFKQFIGVIKTFLSGS